MEDFRDFFAGCLGGCAGVMVGHPFDTVKVRLQLQTCRVSHGNGMLGCFTSIVQKEGMRGLYKGVSSPLLSLAFINAIVFGVEGGVLRRMENPHDLGSVFVAGSIAGLVQSVIACPMELVKTQMQMQGVGETSYRKRKYSSSYDTLKQLYRAKGARAMYRGMSITAARELPSFGVYFVTYEYLCRQFRREGEGFCPTWALLTAGGLAGCASWLNCYPLDVVKSRYQADGQWRKGQLVYSYSGYRDCLRRLIAENGYAGLFRGFFTTLVRAFPTNGATFAVVSLSLRYFRPVTAR